MNTPAPSCNECGKLLTRYQYFGHQDIDPERVKQFGYNGNNIFCTLRCGFRYALTTVRGERVQKEAKR